MLTFKIHHMFATRWYLLELPNKFNQQIILLNYSHRIIIMTEIPLLLKITSIF